MIPPNVDLANNSKYFYRKAITFIKQLNKKHLEHKRGSFWIEILFFILLFAYIIIIAKTKMALIYDEAYNLQVPLSIIKYKTYDTIYGFRNFDGFSTITTGPTVLFPISIIFKIFGVGVLRARSINCLFLFFVLILFYNYLRKNSNKIYALSAILILLTIPDFFVLGLTVLGEIPMLFFLLVGVFLWKPNKINYFSLILFGLALVTKFYFILFVIPLILKILSEENFEFTQNYIKTIINRIIISVNIFIFPFLFWEALKIIIIGKSELLEYLNGVVSVLFLNSFPVTSKINIISQINSRLSNFSFSLFPNVHNSIVISTLFILFFSLTIKTIKRKTSSTVTYLWLISFSFMFWWLFISKEGWFRHIFPFSLIILILIIQETYRIMKHLVNKYQYFHLFNIIISLIILFLIFIPGIEHRSMEFRSTALAEQRIFSQVVKEYINEGYTIGVWGWWQAPEISFLSGGLRFINIEKNNNYLEKNDILVIYTKLHEQLEPKSANELINKLGSPIYISQNYNYYLYTPK